MMQQPNPQGGGQSMMVAKLLQNEAVREELGISKETAEEGISALREIRARLEPEIRGMKMMSPDDRVSAMSSLNTKISESIEGAFSLILTDSQFSRLKQILFQSRGIEAFAHPESQSRLQLRPEQLDELREIFVQTTSQAKEIATSARESGNPEEGRAQMTAFRKEAMDKAIAVLDDTQKATWKEMTGEPFELKMERPGMGGPGMMGRPGMGGPGMMGRPGMGGPGMGRPGMGGPGMGRPGMGGPGKSQGSTSFGGNDDLF